ncbi:MAG: UPF0149 family protein [Azovibrio sp.]|uniref:UPF0149 family protein n=1 Tax=Azovibrio sp. TaxID=1872673 RepID=UPI003C727389
MENLNVPLSESELEQLEALLDSDQLAGQAMGLDQLQAFLCAVASGPQVLPPSVWLSEVIGGEGLPDRETAEALLSLVFRLYNQVLDDLGHQRGVAPILYPLEEEGGALDYGSWADAYLFGANLGDVPWQEAAGEHWDDLAEQLEVLFFLNGSLKEDVLASGETWVSPQEEARWLADAQESLADVVQSIHDFWMARRNIPAPVRRAAPKVGRNDPCPCGSGRKFKQCCGSKTLH